MDNDIKNNNRKFILNKKTAIIVGAVIVVCALVYVYKGLFVAATVNGVPISRFAVIRELEKNSGKNTLDWLITQKLIVSEAITKGITITSEEVDAVVKDVSEQIVSQGGTLEEALADQGLNLNDFKNQIVVQKNMEKLLAGKTDVTDDEIRQYIQDSQITVSEGQEIETMDQIRSMLKSQKLDEESQTLIDSLKAQAKINYFVNY